jgi:integrase
MGMIYRRMVFDGRPLTAPDGTGQPRRAPCTHESHGLTNMCPGCQSEFSPTWWIKFYRAGKPFYESSKSSKIGVARDLLKKRDGQIVEGTFTGVKADKITFEQIAEGYLNDYRVNKKRSLDKAETSVEHLKTRFAGRRAVEITTPEIRAYIAQRQVDQMANATINHELAALNRMFSLAMQGGVLHHQPHIPHLAENNVRTGFFGEVEFLALQEALPSYLKPVALFAYTFGWRKSEILGLTWDRVDLAAGTVRL